MPHVPGKGSTADHHPGAGMVTTPRGFLGFLPGESLPQFPAVQALIPKIPKGFFGFFCGSACPKKCLRNVWSLLGRIADGIITIVILVYLYVYLKFYATWLRQNLCDEPTFRQLATCRGSTQRTWAPAGSVRHLGTCPKSLNHVRNQSKRWFPEIGVPCIDGFYIINHENPQSSIQIIQSARES